MKVSLHWINRYLDKPVDADEAEQLLTRVGFPIESRETSGGGDLLDVEVTSNRSDCLCHVGVARELAAAGERTLKEPAVTLPAGTTPVEQLTSLVNDARDLCPCYTARVVTGVKIGPSPAWLADALKAIGLRPVNNVVDVTNFVLMELGQPLHAFDLAKLAERRIVVRRAGKGESFTAIDGSKHALAADMLVIADAQKPVAIAGVMGGLDSEVSGKTTDILLESAAFEPLSIRTTSRALKLASDSSYRFERGIDPRKVAQAGERAAQLILEVAGGTLADGVVVAGSLDIEPKRVTLRPARCSALLGEEIPAEEQGKYLRRLGLMPQSSGNSGNSGDSGDSGGGRIICTVPTFRLDLRREVDLIEEIARSRGLNNLPKRDRIGVVVRPVQASVAGRRELDAVLVAHGYHETVTPTLVPPEAARAFAPGKDSTLLSVDPSRRKADPILRPSVVPSLLACRKLNQDRGNADVKLYEVASVWPNGEERRVVALLADAADRAAALRAMKGAITELVERLGSAPAFEPTDDPRYEAAATVALGGAPRGVVGVLPAGTFDLQTPVVAAEVELAALLATYPPARRVGDLPRFPGIERDLSVVVDEAVAWRDIEAAVRGTKPAMLESLTFLGVYRGKPIEKGRKSVSFRLLFRDPAGTLTHESVDPQVASAVKALKHAVGAELRG